MSKKTKHTEKPKIFPYWFDMMYDIKSEEALMEKVANITNPKSKLKIECEDWITQGKPSVFKPTGRTQ